MWFSKKVELGPICDQALVDRGLCDICHDCVSEHRDYGPPGPLPNSWHRTVFLLPAVLLLGRVMGYKPPHAQDKRVLSLGLLALFLTFAHDRIASTRLFDWHASAEPYGCLC
jgi:hypothetical protein